MRFAQPQMDEPVDSCGGRKKKTIRKLLDYEAWCDFSGSAVCFEIRTMAEP